MLNAISVRVYFVIYIYMRAYKKATVKQNGHGFFENLKEQILESDSRKEGRKMEQWYNDA